MRRKIKKFERSKRMLDISPCLLRPIPGTKHNSCLDLDPVKNFRVFAVAFGTCSQPKSTAIFQVTSYPRAARQMVRELQASGFLAEVVVMEIPSRYFAGCSAGNPARPVASNKAEGKAREGRSSCRQK